MARLAAATALALLALSGPASAMHSKPLPGSLVAGEEAAATKPAPLALAAASPQEQAQQKEAPREEFPGLGDLGKWASNAADAVSKVAQTVDQGQDALTEAAEMVLLKAAKAINGSLEAVGDKARAMNTTVGKYVGKMKAAINTTENKVESYKKLGQETLGSALSSLDVIESAVKAADGVAESALKTFAKEDAATKLHEALEPVLAKADEWKASANETVQSISGISITNATGPAAEKAVEQLQGPLDKLNDAAAEVKTMATEAKTAFQSFTDSVVEVAKEKLPATLVENVTALAEGVQAQAELQLMPVGDAAQQVSSGLYDAADEAGLTVQQPRSAAAPAGGAALFATAAAIAVAVLVQ